MDNLVEKVKYFLEKYNLLSLNKPILIAFSGGYDSMCLLDILSKLTKNIIAIHLNHNWRGEESDKEELQCRIFCESKGIEFYSNKLSSDIKKTETAAREARYDFFKECAQKYGSNVILTAHNANDNAETILYRIAKGTGTYGLSGIAPKRGIFYRPLLDIKRSEIELYCEQNNLSPNNDSSNKNIKYKRNLIRGKILPEFEKINSKAIDAINSLCEIAQNEQNIIEEYIVQLEEPYKTINFLNYSNSLQQRLLYNLFIKNYLDYDREKIQRAADFIHKNKNSKSGKTLSIGDKKWLYVNCNKIEIITENIINNSEIKIPECGNYKYENKIFTIEQTNNIPEKFPQDKERYAYVNLKDFTDLTLRHRLPGDIISPLGMRGTQKLKKYLNEKKIPQHEKDKLIFLARGNEILWAPGIGLSEKIKVVTTPTHVIKLTNMEK